VAGAAAGYTQSTISGRRWYYVLSLPSAGYLANFAPADLGVDGKWAVYNYDTKTVAVQNADSQIALNTHAKHEYFVLAPLMSNGMAVIGDTGKFVTAADMRLAYVEPAVQNSIHVGVVANDARSPIITGYSAVRPAVVGTGNGSIEETSSLSRLQQARDGWFWDYQTHLWYVKLDFSAAKNMETKYFDIR
jgi:hypothetical protein